MDKIKIVYDIDKAKSNAQFIKKKNKLLVPFLLLSISFFIGGIIFATISYNAKDHIGCTISAFLIALGLFWTLFIVLYLANINEIYYTQYHKIKNKIRKCAVENDESEFVIYTTNRFIKKKIVIPIHYIGSTNDDYDIINFIDHQYQNKVLYLKPKTKAKIKEDFFHC